MTSSRKSRAWWANLSPEKRAEMKKRQAATRTWTPHHYRADLACDACGTDSTVGCVVEVDRG